MNKKRQKIVFNSSSVDDLLARTDAPPANSQKKSIGSTSKISKPESLQNNATAGQSSGFMSHVDPALSESKTSTSYNISDSLLLALDQACLELKAAGVHRNATGRKVTRGHLVEVALFYALQELRKEGLQGKLASLLVDL